MSTQHNKEQTYTIKQAAKLSGLAESNLRYYERIGLISEIKRDSSSGYRVYSEDDINYIVSIACLSATGMSIDNMLEYLKNVDRGAIAVNEQITLLTRQSRRLSEEEDNLKLRQKYIRLKTNYWEAVSAEDYRLADEISKKAIAIAKEVKEFKAQN